MTTLEKNLRQMDKGDDSGRLQTLYEVNDLLKRAEADGLDMNIILPRVLQVAMQELHAQSGSIIVVNTNMLPEYVWVTDERKQHYNTTPYIDAILEKGLAGWVIRNQEPVVIRDSANDRRWLTVSREIKKGTSSVISAPLLSRTEPIGAITITKNGYSEFGTEDLNLLTAIASQAASTIENARLYEESRRQTIKLSALVESTVKISRSLDIDQVVTLVAEQMANLAKAEACTISRWNAKDDTLSLWAEFHPTLANATSNWYGQIPLSDYPVTKEVLEKGTPREIHPGDPNVPYKEYEWLEKYGCSTLLMLPLMTQEGAIGLVELMDTKTRVFTTQEINLVQLLANQAGTTIENARLYRETQHQLRVSTLLNEASKVINSTLDLNEIMQSLLSQMNELLNVDALSIALVDKQRKELVYEVAEGIGSDKIVGLRMPSNEGVSGWVMEHGIPALVPDANADNRFSEHGDERTGFNTQAIICAPLLVKEEVLGTVQAINPIEGTFTENDLQLLVNLANLASSAIANAQQFARTQAAEERYLGLFEDSIDPIILTDNMGHIVEVNKPACVFLEYNRDELLALTLKDLHPDVVETLTPPFLDDLPVLEVRVFSSHVVTKNYKKIPVEVHGKRIITNDNELLQWIHHDISKQVELEEMREDLMAMLFHDLQNPLGNILASLELLNYELPADADPVILSIVEIANRSSKRLQTLVHSLLDINRLEAGHPISNQEMVDVRQLIRDAEEMIRPNLERRNITLQINFSPILPQLFVDEDMIRRVMINLLDNAFKFSPDNKTICLDVVYKPEVGEVLISISDEGMGIPEQYRETIFNKFRRVQSKGGPKGMGLGLAFCRLAVEAHGGRIWVDSAEGGGSRFNFILPTPTN
ncbi:MAG: GAF domain-containing protein [Candidatus Promineifilaceae bacterium]